MTDYPWAATIPSYLQTSIVSPSELTNINWVKLQRDAMLSVFDRYEAYVAALPQSEQEALIAKLRQDVIDAGGDPDQPFDARKMIIDANRNVLNGWPHYVEMKRLTRSKRQRRARGGQRKS